MATTTTHPATTTTLQTQKCPEIPTYEQLRHTNLTEIETYFNKLYTEYNKASPSINSEAVTLNKYEEQLDILSEEMVNKLQDNLTATIEQHNTYTAKQKEVEDNRDKLRQLKQSIKDETVMKDARKSSYNETHDYRESKSSWHTGYITLNVILLLINMAILIKLA